MSHMDQKHARQTLDQLVERSRRLGADRSVCNWGGGNTSAKSDEVVFVSSNRWDIMGAASFGFRPVWVNRAKMPDEYTDVPPAQAVADLSGLASLAL